MVPRVIPVPTRRSSAIAVFVVTRFPAVVTLPPITLPVAETVLVDNNTPETAILPPVMLPLPDTVPVVNARLPLNTAALTLPPVLITVPTPPANMLPPVMLPVALINPPVTKLPPMTLAVALILPPVKMLPVALIILPTTRLPTPGPLLTVKLPTCASPVPSNLNMPNRMLPPVMLPLVDIGLVPNAARLAATLALPYVDAIPVSCDPLPIKKLPVTLPVALTIPPVNTLPPVMLPVTVLVPELTIFPPVMLPVADRYPVTPNPVGPVNAPSFPKVH